MNDVLKILVQDADLDQDAVTKVREEVSRGVLLEDALRSAAPEDKILKSLAAHFAVPFADLASYDAPKEFLAKFPARILLKQHLLPLKEENGAILVATSRLFDTAGLDELTLSTGLDLRPVLAPTPEIDRCIKAHLGIGADTLQSMATENNGVKVVEEESDDMDLSAAAEDAS